ncbi:MAG: hypothetical protein RL660_1537 [Bacteroidota bacterium]
MRKNLAILFLVCLVQLAHAQIDTTLYNRDSITLNLIPPMVLPHPIQPMSPHIAEHNEYLQFPFKPALIDVQDMPMQKSDRMTQFVKVGIGNLWHAQAQAQLIKRFDSGAWVFGAAYNTMNGKLWAQQHRTVDASIGYYKTGKKYIQQHVLSTNASKYYNYGVLDTIISTINITPIANRFNVVQLQSTVRKSNQTEADLEQEVQSTLGIISQDTIAEYSAQIQVPIGPLKSLPRLGFAAMAQIKSANSEDRSLYNSYLVGVGVRYSKAASQLLQSPYSFGMDVAYSSDGIIVLPQAHYHFANFDEGKNYALTAFAKSSADVNTYLQWYKQVPHFGLQYAMPLSTNVAYGIRYSTVQKKVLSFSSALAFVQIKRMVQFTNRSLNDTALPLDASMQALQVAPTFRHMLGTLALHYQSATPYAGGIVCSLRVPVQAINLINTPLWQVQVYGSLRLPKAWQLRTQFLLLGNRYDYVAGDNTMLQNFGTARELSLNVDKQVKKHGLFSVAINNALNAPYQLYSGYIVYNAYLTASYAYRW